MNNFSSATGHTMDFLGISNLAILIMLLGHWIEMNAVGNAGDALKKWQNCYLIVLLKLWIMANAKKLKYQTS